MNIMDLGRSLEGVSWRPLVRPSRLWIFYVVLGFIFGNVDYLKYEGWIYECYIMIWMWLLWDECGCLTMGNGR